MTNKNIGIVTTWFDRGASFVSSAYKSVLENCNHVFIYARGNDRQVDIDQRWENDNVTWAKPSLFDVPTSIVWSDFKKWIEINDIDIVIFNEQRDWNVIINCRKLDIIIGAYIDYYTHQTVPFFQLYDFLICNTQRHVSVFNKHKQCLFIPWGTDCDLFKPKIDSKLVTTLTFFHSSGMSPHRKGTDILLKAFKNVTGNARLIIHSQIDFDSLEIKKLVEEDSRIELIVKTVPPPGLFFLGDVYVYPTRLEGIGLTIYEALASGLPVITTNNAPMNEVVHHGLNGLLCSVEKYQQRRDGYYWQESICRQEDLTKQMQYCVDHPTGVNKLQIAARMYAINYLDWRKNTLILHDRINSFERIKKPVKIFITAYIYECLRYPVLALSALLRKFRSLFH